ncbi:hypothetical protein Aperf_G00000014761 [Anoplocephala perfoliata]
MVGIPAHTYSGRTFFQYRTARIDRPAEMVDDDEYLDENGRPRHQRTASVPAALDRAGLRYNSTHSLNRTHPRDMTIGKAESQDYLGPTKQNVPKSARNTDNGITQPVITAPLLAPSRTKAKSRPPQPQPASRRNQQYPTNGQGYFDNDGSLFDGMSSRGEGSLTGSGIRGAEYEVPRQLSANDFSSYAHEQEDLSVLSGDGVGALNDMGVMSASSVAWSASNSYNPRPSQDSWLPPQAASVPTSDPYFPRTRGEQTRYANIDDSGDYSNNAPEATNVPIRPNRRSGPYVRQLKNL